MLALWQAHEQTFTWLKSLPYLEYSNLAALHGTPRYTMVQLRTQWYRGTPWYSMMYHGIPWYTLAQPRCVTTRSCHGTPWYAMVCHGKLWDTMVHHGIPWCTMVYHGTQW